MRDPQFSDRIKLRVSKSHKKHSNQERRSELLLRNPQFIGELWEVKIPWLCVLDPDLIEEVQDHGLRPIKTIRGNDGLLLNFREEMIKKIRSGTLTRYGVHNLDEQFRWPYQASRTRPKLSIDQDLKSLRKKSYEEIARWLENEIYHESLATYFEWKAFCSRWQIDPKWDGYSLDDLTNHVLVDPLLVSWKSDPRARVDPEEALSSLLGSTDPFLYIRISPWTSLDDIRAAWPHIMKLKKETYGYSERDTQDFERDLCWYDLHNLHEFGKQSYGRITQHWKAWGGDRPHGRNMVIQAVNRIQDYIDRLGFGR